MSSANGVVYQRHRVLIRALKVMRAVSGRRSVNLAALGNQFRVHPRTIARDLQALRAAGISVPTPWRDGDIAL